MVNKILISFFVRRLPEIRRSNLLGVMTWTIRWNIGKIRCQWSSFGRDIRIRKNSWHIAVSAQGTIPSGAARR